ncbi:MAG: transporter substrate-binding domain-containing protein [Erysipelotrichia bacterium]|nr:transporter substrate-binding domain-containing protein [Erysipelotrichia bacterium]
MKKINLLLATLLLLASLCGCKSSTQQDDNKNLLEKIKEKGTIVIATEGMWKPWTYHDDNDKLTGFDVELARLIAEKLGVTAEFAESEFNSGLAGIDSKRYDVMINGVDITPSREEKYAFSDPYCYNHTALIVLKENNDITSFEDLNGKKTANTLQSSYAALAEQYGATVTGVNDFSETIQLLTTGRIDATLNDYMTYIDYITANPDADVKVAAIYPDATSVAIVMRQGEETDSLRTEINKILQELRNDGTLTQLSIKYFGTDITTENITE